MPTTEIALFPLKAGTDVTQGHAASVVKNTFDTLRTIDGMQQINFGTQIENPTMFQLMVMWESLKNHQEFIKSDTYGPFLERFLTIVDKEQAQKMMHADFQPQGALAKVFAAPATEVVTFYFDGPAPADYLENAAKLGKTLESTDGFLGSAIGLTHETNLEHEGVKGQAAVLAVGWQSVDAHMAFRNTQEFKDNIHLLRSESKKIVMNHVNFMEALA